MKDSLNDVDLSADFAWGVMLPISRPAITLEARYTQSILNVAKRTPDFEPGLLPTRFRSSGFELFGGVVYPLGRTSVTEPPARRAHMSGREGRAAESPRRSLAGHAFTPNNLVPDPFIKTFIRNSVGIGSAVDIEFPVAIIDGDTIVGFDGDLVFALLDFEYQRTLRDWLAARGQFKLQARLGTNVGSLLASGITASTGFELGWLARLFQTDHTLFVRRPQAD